MLFPGRRARSPVRLYASSGFALQEHFHISFLRFGGTSLQRLCAYFIVMPELRAANRMFLSWRSDVFFCNCNVYREGHMISSVGVPVFVFGGIILYSLCQEDIWVASPSCGHACRFLWCVDLSYVFNAYVSSSRHRLIVVFSRSVYLSFMPPMIIAALSHWLLIRSRS